LIFKNMKIHQRLSTLLPVLLLLLNLLNAGCNKSSNTNSTTVATVGTYTIVSKVTTATATAYVIITDLGNNVATEQGVCYSATNTNPSINDSKVTHSLDTAVFAVNITGLTANTTYYAKGYCTTAAGTGYGSVIKFKTPTTTFALTTTLSTFSGNGTMGFINGTAANTQYFSPQGVCLDAAGNLYVADSYNNVIRKINSAGISTTFAGTGTLGYIDGPAASAAFYAPSGIVTDAAGNVYVADSGNSLIRKITPAGVVSTLAGKGNPGFGDGTGAAAVFNTPTGLAIDALGNVFVADKGNNCIRKITSAGVVTTIAGNTVKGQVDANGTSAYFNGPTGVTIDATGNLYVADQGNFAVRKVTPAGDVSTLLGTRSLNSIFGTLYGIVADASGNLFITDAAGRLLEITNGVLYTLAGTSGVTAFVNGTNLNAYFNMPQGLTTSSAGVIYIADLYNNAIRKVTVSAVP
jgi:sugar lactone lactonase YvrE